MCVIDNVPAKVSSVQYWIGVPCSSSMGLHNSIHLFKRFSSSWWRRIMCSEDRLSTAPSLLRAKSGRRATAGKSKHLALLRTLGSSNVEQLTRDSLNPNAFLVFLNPKATSGSRDNLQLQEFQDVNILPKHQICKPFRSNGCNVAENAAYMLDVCKPRVRWYGSLPSSEEDSPAGPVAIDYSSVLSEKDFHQIADMTLDHLQERIEEYGEDLEVEGFDIDHAEGVLTVRLGPMGTYVINKQTPNRQIWLSSPVSGPARFDWHQDEKAWVYRRTKAELMSLLEKELGKLLKADISLSK